MAVPLLWNPKLGDLPQFRKLAKRTYTDEEVAWWSERVAFYLQKNAYMTKAMDRASADLKKKHDDENSRR